MTFEQCNEKVGNIEQCNEKVGNIANPCPMEGVVGKINLFLLYNKYTQWIEYKYRTRFQLVPRYSIIRL